MCVRCLAGFLAAADDGAPDAGEWATAKAHRYGHFELLTDAAGQPLELGRGAMGATYRARDTVLHRTVALKVIERSIATLPAARTRFLREARAAARFQHPSVAAVSHYGEQDGECYYVMELVEGDTLEARVQREGPLTATMTLEIASQVAQALVAAETLGIVHRDLKPSNLMLVGRNADGKGDAGAPLVKVIDFGLAKAVDAAAQTASSSETRAGFVGTPAFASPEQFHPSEDTRIDSRADIYSLGVTMWYALCGHSPFSGRTLEEIHAQQSEPLPTGQLLSPPRAPACGCLADVHPDTGPGEAATVRPRIARPVAAVSGQPPARDAASGKILARRTLVACHCGTSGVRQRRRCLVGAPSERSRPGGPLSRRAAVRERESRSERCFLHDGGGGSDHRGPGTSGGSEGRQPGQRQSIPAGSTRFRQNRR